MRQSRLSSLDLCDEDDEYKEMDFNEGLHQKMVLRKDKTIRVRWCPDRDAPRCFNPSCRGEELRGASRFPPPRALAIC